MSHSLVVVGTGFASTFFLHGWLPGAPKDARVLVLERGPLRPHAAQLKDLGYTNRESAAAVINPDARKKPWRFTLGVGGSSACWWGCTPRHLPDDFETRTRYGYGEDWPLSYDDLEPFYVEVEEAMQISGQQDRTPFPMSRPYPLPPHRLSPADEVLKQAFPDRFFHQPTARPSRKTPTRPQCCANGVCATCPIDSKFTVLNTMMSVYEDPRVELVPDAFVRSVDVVGATARAVVYTVGGQERRAEGDVVALGANAIFNPWILLRSGLTHPRLGKGLCEQRGVMAWARLADVDAYGGSTAMLGHAYHFASGPHRREKSAAIVETLNMPSVQDVRGRWRRRWGLKALLEDLPQDRNRVEVDPDQPDKPRLVYDGPSERLLRTAREIRPWFEEILAPLALDGLTVDAELTRTEAHVLCTHPMGRDPATSVTDAGLVHHRVRNLLLLGGGAFPHAPAANPSLTISALSLRAGRALHA